MISNKWIKLFDVACILEIIGCVLLFLIAMPMKYGFGNDSLIRPFGSLHGFFFVAYVILALKIRKHYQWSTKEFALVILYAIIPFFTWFVHQKINKFREENASE